ncbi:MAG: CdvA-like protein [Candidatus Bathyarchaeota archaeon]|nr:CdvA-like protein [Candidatus Bathyarchaeota archaeon]
MSMLTKVISYFTAKHCWCLKLISWKHSFNRLNEEYELAKKKKQALDNLLEKGRISQSTYDSFNSEIAIAIAELEKQQQALLSKMQLKTAELENQIKTLEMLLANYEIQHVAGEIDEETYKLEIELLSNGLVTTKHELESIKEATTQLCAPPTLEAATAVVSSPQIEVAPSPPAITNVEAEVVPASNIAVPDSTESVVDAPVATCEQIPVPTAEEATVEETTAAESINITPAQVQQDTAPTIEEPAAAEDASEIPVEQVAVEVTEPTIEEPTPVVDQIIVEQPTIDETEVIEETIQTETPAVVEEIVTENPCQAPEAAPTENHAVAPEACEETPPVSIPTAKEHISLVETSGSDNSKEE